MLNRLDDLRGFQESKGGYHFDEPTNDTSLSPFNEAKQKINRIKDMTNEITVLKQRYNKEVNIKSYNTITNEYTSILNAGNLEGRKLKEYLLALKDKLKSDPQYIEGTATKQLLDNNLNSTNRAFHDAWQRFQAVAEDFRESVKVRMGRQAKIVKPDVTSEEVDRLVQEGPKEFFSKQMLLGDTVLQKIAEIEETHEKMRLIEQSMREVLELFQDFQTVITLQQESLDIIDHHIEMTQQYAIEGKKNLVEAREYQKKTRSKYCMLFVCLLALLIILAIIFGVLGGLNKL